MRAQELQTPQRDTGQYDAILLKLADMVLNGQRDDPDQQGMVGACVIDPKGVQVCSTSIKDGDKWIHAERAAIDQYEQQHGAVGKNHTVITTLSPCCNSMKDRAGASCTDLLASKGIGQVYAGYQDPTQANKQYRVTKNAGIQQLCKKLADTFLTEISDERLQNYLPLAGKRVDARLAHIARAEEQLNKNYEIYHAGAPSTSIYSFQADTKAEAIKRYQDYLENYNSDVDYDLRLRKNTGKEISENFADGKHPGRKGLAKRMGVDCKQSVSKLRDIAAHSSGERQRMAHWCANMKSGRKK